MTPLPKTAPKEFLEIYVLYRDRVSQEDNLINHRMNWMLWSNAILLAFFAGIQNAIASEKTPVLQISQLKYIPDSIIAFGMICTMGSIFSIYAALSEIDYLKSIYVERYSEIIEAEKRGLLPSIVGHRKHHFLGAMVPWIMPFCLLFLWSVLFLFRHFQAL